MTESEGIQKETKVKVEWIIASTAAYPYVMEFNHNPFGPRHTDKLCESKRFSTVKEAAKEIHRMHQISDYVLTGSVDYFPLPISVITRTVDEIRPVLSEKLVMLGDNDERL